MATINNPALDKLAGLASIKSPKSYSQWLTQDTANARNKKRNAEAVADRRSAYGYGASLEKLSQSTLVNDGYAAYLRNAAKAQRAERRMAEEAEHIKNDKAALSGYANYLRGLRDEDEQRLQEAADSVLALAPDSADRISEIGDSINANAAQREALAALYADKQKEYYTQTGREDLVNRLIDEHYTYVDAYKYCRSLGLDKSAAKSIASSVHEAYSSNTKKLHALFGDG